MVLLPNIFRATSPITETLPVGRLFSHSSFKDLRRAPPFMELNLNQRRPAWSNYKSNTINERRKVHC